MTIVASFISKGLFALLLDVTLACMWLSLLSQDLQCKIASFHSTHMHRSTHKDSVDIHMQTLHVRSYICYVNTHLHQPCLATIIQEDYCYTNIIFSTRVALIMVRKLPADCIFLLRRWISYWVKTEIWATLEMNLTRHGWYCRKLRPRLPGQSSLPSVLWEWPTGEKLSHKNLPPRAKNKPGSKNIACRSTPAATTR